ncbi:MAG: hypothetical protein CMQ53_04885 [Gammaproteobacteria bacterium]|nr:hypothetical protein [Gammaproteobacteria bacterium]|tara:strand:- start:3059 stop:3517 length:459 start_codon:yes stop_codon:yes gene_type:complete
MIIKLVVSNMPAIMTFITLAFILISKESFFKKTERHILRWMVGVLFLWGGLSHLIIPEEAASAIGWKVSPFQKEVGAYDVAVGLTALLASFNKFKSLIPGLVLIYAVFAFYAGVNHLYELVYKGNTNKNNTGFVLFTDLLVPIVVVLAHLKK